MQYDVVIIGGGAAGFFAAINIAEQNPTAKIVILERGRDVLQKVKVSGGGRCNVTHACFDAQKLTTFYPRGEAELLAPFQRFNSTHTVEWFESRGVKLKAEADGRMFPASNSSQTIIDYFLLTARKRNIEIALSTRAEAIENQGDNWKIQTNKGEYIAQKLMLATGSDTAIWNLLNSLDVSIVPPVPSLFTFNIKDSRLEGLMGLSVPQAVVKVNGSELLASGAALITHWGLSGPAVLKLSAWGARFLHQKEYRFAISVNWLGDKTTKQVAEHLHGLIQTQAKKNVLANAEFGIPSRLWKSLCEASNVSEHQKWAETGKKHVQKLSEQLTNAQFEVNGKSTFKEEFVTAGGVDLSEIDFDCFSFKKYPNLYAAGEVLNIDAITGGFNFQAAWTGAWHVANYAHRLATFNE